MLSACAVLSAQTAVEYHSGKFFQDGVALAPDQLAELIGQETYDKVYVPARIKRSGGIGTMAAGGLCIGIGATLFAIDLSSNRYVSSGYPLTDFLDSLVSPYIILSGVAIVVVGAILYADANKKLKNLRPASNGVGISFTF